MCISRQIDGKKRSVLIPTLVKKSSVYSSACVVETKSACAPKSSLYTTLLPTVLSVSKTVHCEKDGSSFQVAAGAISKLKATTSGSVLLSLRSSSGNKTTRTETVVGPLRLKMRSRPCQILQEIGAASTASTTSTTTAFLQRHPIATPVEAMEGEVMNEKEETTEQQLLQQYQYGTPRSSNSVPFLPMTPTGRLYEEYDYPIIPKRLLLPDF